MRRREAAEPLLVVRDGAPGMIRAMDGMPAAHARQRCLSHKMRNLQSKVPEDPGLSSKTVPFGCC
jgi:putative transposase